MAIIQQGNFTQGATAANKTLQIRSDFDYIRVINETAANAAGAGDGVKYEFFRGMTNGRGLVYKKLAADDSITLEQIAASSGFNLVDTGSDAVLGSAVAITAGTNATEPVFSTGSTAGLVAGSIVRLSSMTGQLNLNGYDFAIDTIVANTSFKMAAPLATVPGDAATAGNYRVVNFDPKYYPPYRYIVDISQAANAVVTVSVPSQYEVGQKIKFSVPDSRFGMTEIDGLEGTVTAKNDTVGTQTITVDIDTSGFTAFTFPTDPQVDSDGIFSKAMVYPVGMDTAQALSSSVDLLSDAVTDTGYIGVELVAGASSPGGDANDKVYWQAIKVDRLDNE